MEDHDTNPSVEDDVSDLLELPDCDDELKPRVGVRFRTFEDGVAFYKAYAAACGFTVRKSTIKRTRDKAVSVRYVVCSREGKWESGSDERAGLLVGGKRKRRTSSCRTGCNARIIFRDVGDLGYVIWKFVEPHNHLMVAGGYRRLMKVNRNLGYAQQKFIAKCAKANVGGAKCFRIFKEMVGGFHEIGARKTDFKNMHRDIKSFAEQTDAQLLLEKFGRMKAKNNGFFYSHTSDEEKFLTRLFWADSVAVQNYKIFGEAVAADSTYSTNRYSLIFMPFTGKDNHGRCVNFGAGLISREDSDAYSWLLKTFVDCMGSPPKMLITDQDLGLKVAIEKVLPDTRHRLCMWHIMSKLTEKLPASIRDDGEFFQKFDDMVWSDADEPSSFEEKWHAIMTEFDLFGHKWFDNIYELRMFWIPAYFRDVRMSGLFRTTSPSESENSFFKRYFNRNSNLSEIYMFFENAIESQREDHDALTLVDQTRSPKLLYKLPIERHASTVYTNSIFLEVQTEIDMCMNFCTIKRTVDVEGQVCYDVDEDTVGIKKVTYDALSDFMVCSCNYFVRKGLVCRHMFAVMRVLGYKYIPDKYIEKRWTKKACSIFDKVGQNQYAATDRDKPDATEGLVGLAFKCTAIADGNEEIAEELTTILDNFYGKYANIPGSSSAKGKQKVIEQYYGSSTPESIDTRPPKVAKPKGWCSRKKSKREAAIERAKKPPRWCRKCDTRGYHDSRNCPNVVDEQD